MAMNGSLDLNLLEKRLDEAIAIETPESLNKWLKGKRQPLRKTKKQKAGKREINYAKKILADIFHLVGKHEDGDWELNRATDAMYAYIACVENKKK